MAEPKLAPSILIGLGEGAQQFRQPARIRPYRPPAKLFYILKKFRGLAVNRQLGHEVALWARAPRGDCRLP